jgi:hypothetical protein
VNEQEAPRLDMAQEQDSPLVDTYVTFGTQYGPSPLRETHPVFEWISGDGWVRISAPSREAGRQLAFDIFGSAWAFEYSEVPGAERGMTEVWYPAGELAHITLNMEVRSR